MHRKIGFTAEFAKNSESQRKKEISADSTLSAVKGLRLEVGEVD
jgi:hypothetical protein